MPYYLTSVAELPYPLTMGERPHPDGARSNCPLALEAVIRMLGQHPGRDGYRALFARDDVAVRRRSCDVHTGDWSVILPAVTAFLEPFPVSADTATIASAARDHFAALDLADRRLALALLSYSDSLRVYVNGHGQRETIGQHRICWARTAGVAAVPVWFDATTVAPPRDATLLQRG